jgi:hypothetical protein
MSVNQTSENGSFPQPTNNGIVGDGFDLPDGFDPSWAGQSPLQTGFCLGSVDGRLWFSDEQHAALRTTPFGNPFQCSESGEAINGVECVGSWLVASTRDDLSFWSLAGADGSRDRNRSFPLGVHGISSTKSGFLIAALGHNGILATKPPFTAGIGLTSRQNDAFYGYQAISLGTSNETELLACASRNGGVATVEFSGSQRTHTIRLATFEGLDIVDICELRPGVDSRAVAAVDRSGNLVLFRDVLKDKKPAIMRYDAIQGVAYRILSCRRDIYVLTSKALYVLADLAERFEAGEVVERATVHILKMPMEAVDINLCGDNWLLVVSPGDARKLNARLIHNSAPGVAKRAAIDEQQPIPLQIVGEWGNIEQVDTERMAVA